MGINNLSSVERAFSAHLTTTDSLQIIQNSSSKADPDLIVLPGLGKFGAGISALHQINLFEKIKTWSSSGVKILGICLGMQMMATKSEESPGIEGLGLVPGIVARLPFQLGEKSTHIGWAEARLNSWDKNFESLTNHGDFYFVHSYHFIASSEKVVLTQTQFGKMPFASSILSKNCLGVQFHPEKSGKVGSSFIAEVISWARNED